MIPGLTTKISEDSVIASAATIDVRADFARVTGSTTIATINPHFSGGNAGGGICFLTPTDGAVSTTTTGNIAAAVSMPQNKVTVLVYSRITGKWYPNISA